MKNPFRFFFFFCFAFAMQTGGGRKVASDLSHFPPSVGAWFSCCLFFFLVQSLRYMLGFIYWLVAVIVFTPLSLSLFLSRFPHARTKRLRPMDSGGHTGRVFSAGDRPTTLFCFFLSAGHSTLRQTCRNTSNREKEEKTSVCSLQTFDGLVRCFSFRIYRWHVDG